MRYFGNFVTITLYFNMDQTSKDSILIHNDIETELMGLQLIVSHDYWLKKRLVFNILVGLAGLYPMIFFFELNALFNLMGVILWGIVANAFYSIGYVLESYIITKSKGKKGLKPYRNLLFWLGTISYVLFTLAFGMIYFIAIPD